MVRPCRRVGKDAEQLDNLAALYEANGVKVSGRGPIQRRSVATLVTCSPVLHCFILLTQCIR
ncbi:MAG: hypothetical protein CM1200mP20_13010 [Pseudomonadota bacterium]|nr:MAG: hypothetical protein CM1200mP20_13010 [Pseudomonadota bacterium]